MKCRNCPKVATLHITEIVEGAVQEHHLCEDCARPFLEKTQGSPAPSLGGKSADEEVEEQVAHLVCPSCGMTYKDFRNIGRLGCSHCYVTFDNHLRNLLRRLHGSGQHIGKVYLPPNPSETQKQEKLAGLRRKLDHAVESEDFEQAARIRDMIKSMETGKHGDWGTGGVEA